MSSESTSVLIRTAVEADATAPPVAPGTAAAPVAAETVGTAVEPTGGIELSVFSGVPDTALPSAAGAGCVGDEPPKSDGFP